MNLGYCSITRVEMRGAIEGLKRCWEVGYREVILQMDSIAAISLLSGEGDLSHHNGMETELFHGLRNREWDLIIKHTYREGNSAMDFLANMGYGYPYGSHTFSILDCNLEYFLRYDCMDI
ncbi:Putative ribonuclease H protein At1g65750 [Linum perenne]